ncbi:MAG: hypothetical protein EOO73_22115 [Myxococcales bacterium]|nr:MAG: hypothetical protein EOO73_22115 [Myxococcales bacterium]
MSEQDLFWALVLLGGMVVIILAAVAFSRRQARLRRAQLQDRFGPEYDRAAYELGDARKAEKELSARARRVDKLALRELGAAERARFASQWTTVQAQFVDDPAMAVRSANELINLVMAARGYPVESFEQREADLSVDHAAVIQHYRAARTIADQNHHGRASTEDLRQAMVHYRVLFGDLLQEQAAQGRSLRHSVAGA